MNEYEAKQERRRERYEELADKHRKGYTNRRQASDDATAGIPFGQPILVGHHSEKRHRAALKRSDTNMRKALDHAKTAEYYDDKVAAVGKAGISSDDPEAVDKLYIKLDMLKARQVHMKLVNKSHGQYLKGKNDLSNFAVAVAEFIKNYEPRYSWEPHPFPPYTLTNNNAKIRSVKKRIKSLEATRSTIATMDKTTLFDGGKIVLNTEGNRVQIIFPGKPDQEIRQQLKLHGFRWSRYNMAWQRQLNGNGIHAADTFRTWYQENK